MKFIIRRVLQTDVVIYLHGMLEQGIAYTMALRSCLSNTYAVLIDV